MLCFAGASNVINHGLPDNSTGFSEQIANHFELPLHKIALRGASDDFLIRSILEFLKIKTPTLLIVAWQSWERVEWLYEGKIFQVASSGIEFLPIGLHDRYKEWVIQQSDNQTAMGQKTHNRIWYLHDKLIQQQIPHLFYNEMYPFFVEHGDKDWNKSFIGPYTNNLSCYWYIKNQGIEPDKSYHFGINGHTAWAKLLIDYIEENKII